MRKRHGFTIVELLIVIVVVGILAAVVVVSYQKMQVRARNSARSQTASSFRKALEMLTITHGSVSDLLVTEPFGMATACYSRGLPDRNSDGAGDCHWLGNDTIVASETSLTAALASISPIPGGQVYPKIVHSDGLTYLAPFAYAPIIDGSTAGIPVIEYSLEGSGTDCRLGPIVDNTAGGYSMNTSGRKDSVIEDNGNYTVCIIRVGATGYVKRLILGLHTSSVGSVTGMLVI